MRAKSFKPVLCLRYNAKRINAKRINAKRINALEGRVITMNSLTLRLLTASASTTLVIFLYCLLGELGLATPINNHIAFDLILLNFLVAGLMLLTDQLHYTNTISNVLVHLLDLFLVVFGIGGGFLNMFSFEIKEILITSIMLLIVYFCVFGINFLKEKSDAKMINLQIKEQRKKNND